MKTKKWVKYVRILFCKAYSNTVSFVDMKKKIILSVLTFNIFLLVVIRFGELKIMQDKLNIYFYNIIVWVIAFTLIFLFYLIFSPYEIYEEQIVKINELKKQISDEEMRIKRNRKIIESEIMYNIEKFESIRQEFENGRLAHQNAGHRPPTLYLGFANTYRIILPFPKWHCNIWNIYQQYPNDKIICDKEVNRIIHFYDSLNELTEIYIQLQELNKNQLSGLGAQIGVTGGVYDDNAPRLGEYLEKTVDKISEIGNPLEILS